MAALGERLEARQMLSIQPVTLPQLGTANADFPYPYVSISADGHLVAFATQFKLVAEDSSNVADIYVHDMQSGTYLLASTGNNGQSNGWSQNPSLSADGRYVAMQSNASNLTSGDTNGVDDIFMRDLQTGTTVLVSVGLAGPGNGQSINPSISADGRFVAFFSEASNLTPGDTNGVSDLFVRDLQTGTTTRGPTGSDSIGSARPSLSGNGRYVAFESAASDLTPGDTNSAYDVFVYDLQSATTTRASTTGGIQGNSHSFSPTISSDGRYVAFHSDASNFVPGDNSTSDVFVRDMQTGLITLVSTGSTGHANAYSGFAAISADGRYVAFSSSADNLVPRDVNGTDDIFVRDLQLGKTRMIKSGNGELANQAAYYPGISANGRFVAFYSKASNLTPGDTNDLYDIFLWDDDRLDFVPPTVSGIAFTAAGSLNTQATSLTLSFSEPTSGLSNGSEYRLQNFGPDGQFDTADDIETVITGATYSGTTATLHFAPLAAGVYRLVVKDSIVDEVGNHLDGDGDGQPLGDYVTEFPVIDELVDGGWLDPSFGNRGKATTLINGGGIASAVALQPDGKVVVAGYVTVFINAFTKQVFGLARYNADGSLDTSFGNAGTLTTPIGDGTSYAFAVAVQPDGKIIAAGSSNSGTADDFAAVRYNADGSLDTTFGSGGILTTNMGGGGASARAVVLQSDGKIVLVGLGANGTSAGFALVRYNVNGSLDTGFGAGGIVVTPFGTSSGRAYAAALQGDGKIIVAGVAIVGGSEDFALVRYNTNGTVDTSFGAGGKVNTPFNNGSDEAHAVTIQPDGKIVVAGLSNTESILGGIAIARYNTNGSLDTDFGSGGKVVALSDGSKVNGLVLQADGKILAACDTSSRFTIVRLTTSGALDPSFGTSGVLKASLSLQREVPTAITMQPDGRFVVAGYANKSDNSSSFEVVRFHDQPEGGQPVAQYAFYNNSQFDGASAAATSADDGAIATDKAALRPGGTANFANYTSYSRGINGVMIDIAGTSPALLTAADLDLRIGNDDTPDDWPLAPAPTSISVRPGEGAGGSDRFTLTWPDGAIKNTWLEVTVLATAATRLAQPYVFYYGNAIADSGNSPINAVANATDEIAARNHPQTFLDPAGIDNHYDYDRDGLVNATDQILARENSSTLATALRLINLPTGSLAPASGAPAAPLADESDDPIAIGLAATVTIASDSRARTLVETPSQTVLATSNDVVIERDSARDVWQAAPLHAIDAIAADSCLDEQLLELIAAELVVVEL